MKIKILKPMQVGPIGLKRGSVVIARKLPDFTLKPKYQIIEDGPFCGAIVEYEGCVELPCKSEEREQEHQDQIKKIEQRHAYEVQLLTDTIDRAIKEQEPVSVPKNVADAIESFRKDGRDVDYIMKNLIEIPYRHRPRERLKVLADFGRENGYTLVCALANGFVVESLDDRLRSGIKEILDKWDADTAGGVFPDKVPLTDRITEFVQGVYAAQ